MSRIIFDPERIRLEAQRATDPELREWANKLQLTEDDNGKLVRLPPVETGETGHAYEVEMLLRLDLERRIAARERAEYVARQALLEDERETQKAIRDGRMRHMAQNGASARAVFCGPDPYLLERLARIRAALDEAETVEMVPPK